MIPLLICVYVCILAYVWHTHPPTHIYIWGPKQLKDKRNYFSVLFQVIAHHRGKSRQDRYSRQELRQRLQKNAGYSFVLFWLKLCQLSYKTQDCLLSGGTTHSGRSPPTSINNQDNSPLMWPQANLISAIPKLRLFPPKWLLVASNW